MGTVEWRGIHYCRSRLNLLRLPELRGSVLSAPSYGPREKAVNPWVYCRGWLTVDEHVHSEMNVFGTFYGQGMGGGNTTASLTGSISC